MGRGATGGAAASPATRTRVRQACRSTRGRWRAGDLFVARPRRAVRRRTIRGAALDARARPARWSTATPVGRGTARPGASGRVVIEVDDTTAALQDAGARECGAGRATKVVAITGSAGKTTTKEVTAEFLAARYRVVRNSGNLNNHIGLPLSLIELRTRPEMAVVELGMNHAGEIRTLVAHRRAGCARVDERRRGAHRVFRVARRHRRRQGRDPRGGNGVDAAGRQRRRPADRARASALSPAAS